MTKWISDYWGPIEGEPLADRPNGMKVVKLSKMVYSTPEGLGNSYPPEYVMTFTPDDLHELPEPVTKLADEIQAILADPCPQNFSKLIEIEKLIEPHTTKPSVEESVKVYLDTIKTGMVTVDEIFEVLKPYLKDEL